MFTKQEIEEAIARAAQAKKAPADVEATTTVERARTVSLPVPGAVESTAILSPVVLKSEDGQIAKFDGLRMVVRHGNSVLIFEKADLKALATEEGYAWLEKIFCLGVDSMRELAKGA